MNEDDEKLYCHRKKSRKKIVVFVRSQKIKSSFIRAISQRKISHLFSSICTLSGNRDKFYVRWIDVWNFKMCNGILISLHELYSRKTALSEIALSLVKWQGPKTSSRILQTIVWLRIMYTYLGRAFAPYFLSISWRLHSLSATSPISLLGYLRFTCPLK